MTEPKRKIVMVKRVAREWIRKVAHPEYRFKVLYGAREIRNLPNLLYSFRDGKVAMVDVPCVPDLGVQEGFDGISLWSRDQEGLQALQRWFEKRGFETTGVF